MQFIPQYDIMIGDGYGYPISSHSVSSKGVCPWGKHLGYALLLPQKCAPALARIVAESLIFVAVLHHKVVASLREKKEIESGIIVNKGGYYKQR